MTIDFINILQDYFTGTIAILPMPQYQWSNPQEYDHMNPQRTHNTITTKQSTTKPYAYIWAHTVCWCSTVHTYYLISDPIISWIYSKITYQTRAMRVEKQLHDKIMSNRSPSASAFRTSCQNSWDPSHKGFMSSWLKSRQNYFCYNFNFNYATRSQFCTYHDSWAVMALLLKKSNMNFDEIWIMTSYIVCKTGRWLPPLVPGRVAQKVVVMSTSPRKPHKMLKGHGMTIRLSIYSCAF